MRYPALVMGISGEQHQVFTAPWGEMRLINRCGFAAIGTN
ncbi:hypothetical protein EDC91_11847 [Shewanella fodinae]|uniref:Uncharacterized protein n=1 Tax=Shewanella fodinae TaxID=552357 RepID=A0A4R2F6Y2_9GAMM|nr:hypothetical protein EDC91_11847 [Shewanella fodinae]